MAALFGIRADRISTCPASAKPCTDAEVHFFCFTLLHQAIASSFVSMRKQEHVLNIMLATYAHSFCSTSPMLKAKCERLKVWGRLPDPCGQCRAVTRCTGGGWCHLLGILQHAFTSTVSLISPRRTLRPAQEGGREDRGLRGFSARRTGKARGQGQRKRILRRQLAMLRLASVRDDALRLKPLLARKPRMPQASTASHSCLCHA